MDWPIIITQLIAVAGYNQTIYRSNLTFDGSGSGIDIGSITNYTWTFTDGTAQELWEVSPSYHFQNLGDFIVMLNITDGNGNYSFDNMTVTVENIIPVADAGWIQPSEFSGFRRLYGNESYDLDEYYSSGPLNWTWSFTYSGSPIEVYGEQANFFFDIIDDYLITLNVTDTDGGYNEDTVWLNISRLVDYYDDGIFAPSWTMFDNTVQPTWAFLDGTFDAFGETSTESVHKLSCAISASFHSTGIYNNTHDLNSNLLIQWKQYVDRIDKDDNILLTIENFGKKTVLKMEEDAYTLNGVLTPYTLTDEVWREWSIILMNSGTDAYLFLDGDFLTMESTSLTSTLDNITFRMYRDDIGSSSFTWFDYIIIDEYTGVYVDAGDDQQIYSNSTAQFDGSGSDINTIQNYTWAFTYDGSPQEIWGENPTFDFTNIFGTYLVTLTATDGVTADTDTMSIEILNRPPVADAGPDQITKRLVTFDGSGSNDPDGSIINYTWFFMYDSILTYIYGINPTFDFNISGTYDVWLMVEDELAEQGFDNVTIEIVILNPIAQAGPDTVRFRGNWMLNGSLSDDPDGTIENYTWTFTDITPQILYGPTPTYDFQNVGVFTIWLTVTDDDWRTGMNDVWITINNQGPIADAGPYQQHPAVKGTRMLNGTLSYDPDGTIENYTWTFTYDGVPQTLYGETPSFFFNITGSYWFTLVVRDFDGATDSDTTLIQIVYYPPIADAGTDQAGLRGIYIMNGFDSDDPDGVITNYTWTFNDGGIQTLYGMYPQYDFTNLGNFEITLNVTDDDWRYGEDTTWVNTTNQPPIANAGPDQDTKRNVTFDGSGSSDEIGIVNYTWNFTYDSSSVELWGINPYFDFNISGVYIVMLNVTDGDGASGFDNVTITISFDLPIADAGPDQGILKSIYWLDGSGSDDLDGTIENYTWTFIYGGSPIELWGVNPSFNFLLEGSYDITLNITDDDWRYGENITTVDIVFLHPIAEFTWLPYDTNKGIKQIIGSGSDDLDGTIVNFTWTFTYDGSPQEIWTENFDFNFSIPGIYPITLLVEDDDGLTDSITESLSIVLKPPIAITASNKTVYFHQTASFDASDSYDIDGYILNYTWILNYSGTNYTLYGEEVYFRFNGSEDTGIFNMTLIVTDDDGLTGWTNMTVYVYSTSEVIVNWLLLLIPLVIIFLVIYFIKRRFDNYGSGGMDI